MAIKTKNHEFEKIVIKGILESKDLCKKLLTKNFSEEIFDIPIHRFIWNQAKERFNKLNELTDYDSLKYHLEQTIKNPDERKLRISILEDSKNDTQKLKDVSNKYNFCWQEILKCYQRRTYLEVIEGTLQRFNNEPDADPFKIISDAEKGVVRLKKSSNKIIIDREDIFSQDAINKRVDLYKHEKINPITSRTIPYFLPKLTDVTGGIKPTDLILFIARQKVGKSITLLNQGIHLCKLGYNVAYVSIEQSKEEITLRADSLSTDLKHIDLKLRKLNDHNEVIYQAKLKEISQSVGKFIVIDIPKGCSVPLVEKEIHEILDSGTNINAIIIDYLGLLNSDGDSDKFYFNIGIIARQLKEICRELKIPIITAHQMTRASENERIKTSSSIAYSDQIGSHVDYCYALHPLGEGKLEVQTVLARDSEPVTVPCITLFEKMLIMEQGGLKKQEETSDDDFFMLSENE